MKLSLVHATENPNPWPMPPTDSNGNWQSVPVVPVHPEDCECERMAPACYVVTVSEFRQNQDKYTEARMPNRHERRKWRRRNRR